MTLTRPLAAWLAAAAVAAAPVVGAGSSYQIDRERSSIRFLAPYDFMLVGIVEGEFGEFSGTAVVDLERIESSSIEVEIQAASLTTDLKARDVGLRGDLFFAADRYPTIRFRGREVAATPRGYEMLGTLQLRGVERELRLPFRLLPFGEALVILGRGRIARREFGIKGPEGGPDFAIGEAALIVLELTLVASPGE